MHYRRERFLLVRTEKSIRKRRHGELGMKMKPNIIYVQILVMTIWKHFASVSKSATS